MELFFRNLLNLISILPFFSIVFYGLGDVRITLILDFAVIFLFACFLFLLRENFSINLSYNYEYFLVSILISLLSYFLSPVKHIISIDFVGFLCGFIIFLLAIHQDKEINLSYIYPFLIFIVVAAVFSAFVNKGEFTSTLRNENTFAFVSILIVGMMIEYRKFWWALIFLVIIILTRSIGALISIMLVSFYYAFKNRKNINLRKNAIVLIIIALIFSFLVYHIDTYSVLNRVRWWGYSIDMFKERPIFGWGYSSFTYVSKRYYSVDVNSIYVHNYFLETLSDFGILFFIFWIYFLYSILRFSSGFYRYSLIASLVHSFFDFGINTSCGWWLFMYVCGISVRNKLFVFRVGEGYRRIKFYIRIFAFGIFVMSFWMDAIYFDIYYRNRKIIELMNQKNYQSALRVVEDSLKKHPKSIDIALRRYEIYWLLYLKDKKFSNLVASIESLEYLLLLNPYYRDKYKLLEELYFFIGDKKSLSDLITREKIYLKSL